MAATPSSLEPSWELPAQLKQGLVLMDQWEPRGEAEEAQEYWGEAMEAPATHRMPPPRSHSAQGRRHTLTVITVLAALTVLTLTTLTLTTLTLTLTTLTLTAAAQAYFLRWGMAAGANPLHLSEQW